LIIHHATIYTVDSLFTRAESLIINDGKIIFCGTNDEAEKKFEGIKTVDARGWPER
jgi:predicted amidohydrolase YtcJ